MAWQSEFWNQDDNVFHGYPIPVDTIHVEHDVDTDGLALPWLFDEKFYGYPVQVKISRVNHAVDYTGLLPVWLFDDKFYGYPHVPEFYEQVEWTEPITDRNNGDILNAIKQLKLKKQYPEIEFEFTKAFLNAVDMNRIEGNTAVLASKLKISIQYNINWKMADLPVVNDRKRILKNMETVHDTFLDRYPEIELPEVPKKLNTILDFNNLEQVQFQIYQAFAEMEEGD